MKNRLRQYMKRCILMFFISIIAGNLLAQPPKAKNLQRFDNKRVHFGFALGFNSGGFALQRKPTLTGNDSLASLDVINQSGFNLGIVTDLHLTNHLGLRFVPTLVFGQRNLEYRFLSPNGDITTVNRAIESTYLDFPFLLKYRSVRLNNFAAYFIIGAKYSLDLASDEDVNNDAIPESIVKLKQNTTSAEVGIGTDFFLPYFKFAIELKMSYGLQDVLIRDNTELSNPIEQIIPKMFFISFLFEG